MAVCLLGLLDSEMGEEKSLWRTGQPGQGVGLGDTRVPGGVPGAGLLLVRPQSWAQLPHREARAGLWVGLQSVWAGN